MRTRLILLLVAWCFTTSWGQAPEVPPPTRDQEGTERSWDITHPDWRNKPAEGGSSESGEERRGGGGLMGLLFGSPEQAELRAEQERQRAIARKQEAFGLNEQGNRAYERRDWKTARDYYKKALRLSSADKVMQQNLKNAENSLAQEEERKRMVRDLARQKPTRRPLPTGPDSAEIKRQEEEKQRKEEEERKRNEEDLKRQVEEARRAAELWRAELERQKAEARSVAFENDKAALLAQFQIPTADVVPTAPEVATVPPEAQETASVREFHGIVALMRGKNLASLPPEQRILLAEGLIARQNRLWRAAVNDPQTTAVEREHLTVPLPSDDGSMDEPRAKLRLAPYRPPETATVDPDPEASKPFHHMLVVDLSVAAGEELALRRGAEIADRVIGAGAGETVENFVGVGKIVIEATESTSKGVAAGVNLLIGALEIPQASWAVTGGRLYSKVAFEAMNQFMTKATEATGGHFDSEEFWTEFRESLTTAQRSVCDWIEYVPDKD